MAINYEKYLKILAKSFKQVFEEMARKQADSYVVKASRQSDASEYAVGVAVPYSDEKEHLSGKFLLGLSDKSKAVQMASTIAQNSGLPAITEFDDLASDILYEFMNTVVGQTMTAWDKLGLSATFGTPFSLDGQNFEKTLNTTRETYIVSLNIGGESIAIFVTFEVAMQSAIKGKKILVVDDSRMVRMVLRLEFEKQGCVVVEAADGKAGVDAFKAETPDLIFMDLVMPNMGGLEAIEKIRAVSREAKVVVLTSTAKRSEVLAAAALGINGYVIKPIKPGKIMEVATACFRQ